MAIPSSLNLFLIVSHLLIIVHLVEGQESPPAICPLNEFKCGDIGNMSFPFTESNQTSCGICLVDCHGPKPRIKLWGEENSPEDWQNIVWRSRNQIMIEVPQSCLVFRNNPLPSDEHISFTISPNLITMLKCDSGYISEISKFLPNHGEFSECEGITIYYNYSDTTISDYNGTPPPYCSTIQLALANRTFNQEEESFFDILPKEISLEWSFTSSSEKPKKLGAILGSVVGGMVFILIVCGIIFIMWRRKKRNKDATHLLSRNISSDPSSRADVEVGSVRFGVKLITDRVAV